MKFNCIAIDFDNCLAYYRDKRAGLFRVFTESGVDEPVARRAYDYANDHGGFSLDSVVSILEKEENTHINRGGLRNRFNSWLSLSIAPYPDVNDFMERAKSLNVPVAVITYGNKDYQKEKIRLTKISCGKLIVTPTVGEKYIALKQLIDLYGVPIAFIDDRRLELDNTREHFGETEVVTFHVMRVDAPRPKTPAKFKHQEIKTLSEIFE